MKPVDHTYGPYGWFFAQLNSLHIKPDDLISPPLYFLTSLDHRFHHPSRLRIAEHPLFLLFFDFYPCGAGITPCHDQAFLSSVNLVCSIGPPAHKVYAPCGIQVPGAGDPLQIGRTVPPAP